jgi:hypothetical protein
MRSFLVSLSRGLGVLLGAAAATMAQGQQITVAKNAIPKPPAAKKTTEEPKARSGVYRIELYAGPSRTVRYMFSGDVPSHEREVALDMQRAENEMMYVQDMERLKQAYVNGERIAEAHRQDVQRQLYGTSITTGRDLSRSGGGRYLSGYGGLYGGYGLYGGGLGFLGGYGMYGMGYSPYGIGGYGTRAGGYNSYSGESWQTVNRSLQNGVGDEGKLKDAMAQAVAKQSTPEYATEAQHHYEKAVARTAEAPMVARAMSLPKTTGPAVAYEPSFTRDSHVVVWVGGDKYDGTVKEDHPGWVVLTTDEGELRLRKSEIGRSVVKSGPARNQGTHPVSHQEGVKANGSGK